MLKKLLLLAIAGFWVVGLWSCDKSGDGKYKKTPTGLKYKIFLDKEGRPAAIGDFMTLNFIFKAGKTDSIWSNTFTQGSPIVFNLTKPTFQGSLEEGLAMLSEGDSAEFLVSADSMFTVQYKAPLPPGIEKGSNIKFIFKVLKIQTQQQMEEEKKRAAAEQIQKDEAQIQNYLKTNNITAERYESGLYYQRITGGAGDFPKAGDKVAVHYTGTLLNGTKFDSSIDRGEPLSFAVGQQQVIAGWDEGIMKMKKGEKGKLFIPSNLAYGAQGAGGVIPPFSILIFDVELVNFGNN